jgi:Ca2+:H+ antiporter
VRRAIVGVIIAAIVLLPETTAVIRAAARRQLQASINLALGSAVASIGLSVPVVAIASFWIGQPLELGISAGATVLMALGFVVAIITYGTGRTNLLSGIVHLVLLAAEARFAQRHERVLLDATAQYRARGSHTTLRGSATAFR